MSVAILDAAGVGQATLYRHFPTREDLVLAVYEADVRHWLAELAEYGRVKRGVARVVLAAATRRAVADRWRPLVLDALQSLLDAGAQAGRLRGDLDAEDVWPLLGFLWNEELSEQRAQRLISVVLDGLAGPSASRPRKQKFRTRAATERSRGNATTQLRVYKRDPPPR
ncbi:MAG TPA: helix-turn-helix domain-containing protein [Solirubrobacteraceae bacterium]|nr:helix-turn-helix domain-containing protein [Solirubrobacteraceae bacterium]